MDTLDLQLWLDIVGAAGVIASLVYLATQIRQNTVATRSSTLQQLTQRLQERLLLPSANPQLADLMAEDWQTHDFTPGERLQATMWVATVIIDVQDIYRQCQLKVIPFSVLAGRVVVVRQGMFKSDLAKSVWQSLSQAYDSEFVQWFDLAISKPEGAPVPPLGCKNPIKPLAR